MASSTPGAGRAVVGAVEADRRHRHVVLALHEVVLEADLGSPSPSIVTMRAQRVVGRPAAAASSSPHPAAISAVTATAERRRRRRSRAVQVGAEVAVAEVEPASCRRSGRSVSIACHVSPARPQPRLRVDRAGERVGDRVEVGADVQAVQHDVVADVDDRGDLGRADAPARGR